MAERIPSEQEANALNELMARQMELRGQQRLATANERRRICSFSPGTTPPGALPPSARTLIPRAPIAGHSDVEPTP